MQKIEVLLTPHAWLQAPADVRNLLKKEFGFTRSSSPQCTVERGITRIQSDGCTVDDLRAMNPESMQKWLGFKEIDAEADVHALLQMCADKAEAMLHPVETEDAPPAVPEPEPPKETKPAKKTKS
jgi:hypothetical protein